jgi:outer membrane murein-binding lipoprotein Lpp
MRRQQFSFLEVSQDPLMTILALVLLGTVWLILPGPPRASPPERNPAVTAQPDTRMVEDVSRLGARLAQLQNEIEWRRRESKALEDELRKERDAAAKAEGKVQPSEIQTRIYELEREIEKKQKELEELQRQIASAKQQAAAAEDKRKRESSEAAQLQLELKAKQDELESLRKALKPQKREGGYKEVFESKKRPAYFELVNNRLFILDPEFYDERQAYYYKGGGVVSATVCTRKASAPGEGAQALANPRGRFLQKLKELDANDQRPVFLVHGDSFEIFRKAREIAEQQSPEWGWWPFNLEKIVFTPPSASDPGVPSQEGQKP